MKYYLPLYYTYISRLKRFPMLISWIMIAVIPLWFFALNSSEAPPLSVSVTFIIALLTFYYAYEIGYLENDIKTTTKEKTPTFRLTDAETNLLRTNINSIVRNRYLILLSLLISLYYLADEMLPNAHVFPYITGVTVTILVFAVHNNLRNKINIVTFFALSSLKYTVPVIPFMNSGAFLESTVLLILAFPLIRTIEHISRKRYGIIRNEYILKNRHLFRVIYYLTITALFLSFGWIENIGETPDTDSRIYYIYVYFLLYRTTVIAINLGLPKLNHRSDR